MSVLVIGARRRFVVAMIGSAGFNRERYTFAVDHARAKIAYASQHQIG